MSLRTPFIALVLAFAHANGAKADLVVYDDALRNAFQDYSYGGGSDFANPAPVHAGTRSIRLTGNAYNAVSFFHAGAFSFAQYAGLRFWVHGGSAGGQRLTLALQNGGNLASVALNGYIAGGAPAANTWREVTVPIATIPSLAALGQFDRIDIQSDDAGAQPAVYFDDVVLTGAVVDRIFADGFDGGGTPAANGLVVDHDVPIDGLSGDRFTWRDSANQPRVAVLAHNDGGTGTGGTRGGELREFRYQVGGATRIVKATDGSFGGFGYVVSHPANEANDHCTGEGDPSSLGHFTPGSFQRVFEGRHHAIFRFRQNYPRYCTRLLPPERHDLPVTIDWVFSTGRDHPLWSVTWDLSGVPVDRLEDDARGPYGQMRIDGAASDGARAQIAGVAWGDYYRFVSTSNPVTFGSGWSWNQPNAIPYVKLWTSTVDATMGLVQTRTIRQQDAGGYWGQGLWGRTSANGNGCDDPGSIYPMPCDYNWPFQSINYELYGGATQNARLAWGTNFGFLGQAQYRIRGNSAYGGGALALPGDPTASGWPKKSYATWIVLGTHGADPVGAQVRDVETIQNLALTATVGSVAMQGPSGVADANPATYQPAGYDGVLGALAFQAAANRLDANVAVGAGTLSHPLVIVRDYSGALPATVKLGGAMLVRDVDYFPSLRAGSSELWLTLNRDLAGASNRLEIAP